MRLLTTLATAAFALLAAQTASAQTVALGTTKGGSTGQVGTAIANVATTAGEIRVIPQETANTAQYIPMVDQGRIEFGIANYPQTAFAITGTGLSEGKPSEHLQIVATLMDFKSGMLVLKASGIESTADLAGHKVPRFPDNSLGDFVIRAVLATADLTYDDVEEVPMANFPSMFQGLKDGTLDTSIATIGSAAVMDIAAAAGDVKFLSFDEADDAEQLDSVLPGTLVYDVTGSEQPGVEGETKIFGYPYLLFANDETPAEVVTAMIQALYEGKDALLATSPMWDTFYPETMARATGLPYHPAAAAFYEEKGLLPEG